MRSQAEIRDDLYLAEKFWEDTLNPEYGYTHRDQHRARLYRHLAINELILVQLFEYSRDVRKASVILATYVKAKEAARCRPQ